GISSQVKRHEGQLQPPASASRPSDEPQTPNGPKARTRRPRPLPQGLVMIYEDRDILVVDKPPGLLTISTETEKERTAYFLMMDYVRKGCAKSRNRVFVVHRLDRETSGLLVMAKSHEAKAKLQDQWDRADKKYLAIVHGRLEKRTDTISTYLAENSARVVYSTSNTKMGKLSHTAYRVLKQAKEFALLEVALLTGRKNQIRVHLAGIGHPVAGDKKYGKGIAFHKKLSLHAYSITLKHPVTGRMMTFAAKVPPHFYQIVGSIEGMDENYPKRPD
ncbi:MAG: RluA family pseudouridine synthase, partial [Candidatus Sumerlaeaceae bacterium]|nr:RluA family pseudouridine synthase [Candidatus Sumerlaeaceae bacterium]